VRKFLRRFAVDGDCQPLSRSLGIIITAIGGRSRLLPPRLLERPGIKRVKTRLVHKVHNDLLGSDIIPRNSNRKAAGRAFRMPEFRERVGQDVLNALLIGRPSCFDTHTLCGIPASTSGVCRSRKPG
jgi:hypothetical protein